VIACNSAASAGLEAAREVARSDDVEVVAVIEPEAEIAAAVTETGNVGVLATPATVRSGAYRNALARQHRALTITEVEAPESVYRGPAYASYFGFESPDVFAWTYVVGDGRVHIGTAAISTEKSTKKDMRFDAFLEYLKQEDYVDPDFEPKEHHTSGGSIRMFAKAAMSTADGTCHVIGDAAIV